MRGERGEKDKVREERDKRRTMEDRERQRDRWTERVVIIVSKQYTT